MNNRTPRQTPSFVACGMYAFTDELKTAWQKLFDLFFDLASPEFEIDPKLKFEADEALLRDPSLWFGHSCGYPLMTRLSDSLTPVCLPIFDLEGCEGKHYSSRFIVSRESDLRDLRDCRGLVAAINSRDSNSGMNVLRHAVADCHRDGTFFGEVRLSGSHLQSLIAVADRSADVAAIDCVSFGLIEDAWPERAAGVRTIGFSARTCGLPLIMPRSLAEQTNTVALTRQLNQALSRLDLPSRRRLHLAGFEDVAIGDYRDIIDLETEAQRKGYPLLA